MCHICLTNQSCAHGSHCSSSFFTPHSDPACLLKVLFISPQYLQRTQNSSFIVWLGLHLGDSGWMEVTEGLIHCMHIMPTSWASSALHSQAID